MRLEVTCCYSNSRERPSTNTEQKVNLENLKKIMNSEKTTLSSLGNIEWKTVKRETIKLNQVLHYISTNNITELNELINTGANLVVEKLGYLKKHTKIKTRMGNSTGNADKKIYEDRSKW